MHTLGAVVLAVIAALVMEFLFGLVMYWVGGAMFDSVGAILPLLIKVALTGCAYFGGAYFALTLVPSSNSTIVMRVLLAFAAVATVYGMVKAADAGAPAFVHAVQLAACVAIAVGLWVARNMVDDERGEKGRGLRRE